MNLAGIAGPSGHLVAVTYHTQLLLQSDGSERIRELVSSDPTFDFGRNYLSARRSSKLIQC
jgi:hypothetical protein